MMQTQLKAKEHIPASWKSNPELPKHKALPRRQSSLANFHRAVDAHIEKFEPLVDENILTQLKVPINEYKKLAQMMEIEVLAANQREIEFENPLEDENVLPLKSNILAMPYEEEKCLRSEIESLLKENRRSRVLIYTSAEEQEAREMDQHYSQTIDKLNNLMTTWAGKISRLLTKERIDQYHRIISELSSEGEVYNFLQDRTTLAKFFAHDNTKRKLLRHFLALGLYTHVLCYFAFGMDRVESNEWNDIELKKIRQGIHSNQLR